MVTLSMKYLSSQKKLLAFALLEDVLVMLFFFTLLASSLEILLPGILANRIPLAGIFTVFTLLLFGYAHWKKELDKPLPSFSLPPSLLVILFVLLILVTLFMNRDFGFLGAALQLGLIVLALFYSGSFKKLS